MQNADGADRYDSLAASRLLRGCLSGGLCLFGKVATHGYLSTDLSLLSREIRQAATFHGREGDRTETNHTCFSPHQNYIPIIRETVPIVKKKITSRLKIEYEHRLPWERVRRQFPHFALILALETRQPSITSTCTKRREVRVING